MISNVVRKVMNQQKIMNGFCAHVEVPFLLQVQQYFDKAASNTDIPQDRLKYTNYFIMKASTSEQTQ